MVSLIIRLSVQGSGRRPPPCYRSEDASRIARRQFHRSVQIRYRQLRPQYSRHHLAHGNHAPHSRRAIPRNTECKGQEESRKSSCRCVRGGRSRSIDTVLGQKPVPPRCRSATAINATRSDGTDIRRVYFELFATRRARISATIRQNGNA